MKNLVQVSPSQPHKNVGIILVIKEEELLIPCFTGGCGKAKEPILTFPLSTSLDSVSDDVFRKILIYLTRISRFGMQSGSNNGVEVIQFS